MPRGPKEVPSSWLAPIRNGTLTNLPALSWSVGDSFKKSPSMTGNVA